MDAELFIEGQVKWGERGPKIYDLPPNDAL